MEIGIDSIWCSPTTLHMRVLVWVGQNRYQKRFDAHVPLDDIEPEAVRALMRYAVKELDQEDDHQQLGLF